MLARENDDLPVARHVHSEPLLHYGREMLPRRKICDVGFQPRALALEIGALSVELLEAARFRDAHAPPPDDHQRDYGEDAEQRQEDAAPPHPYRALRHTRRLALRARGLR